MIAGYRSAAGPLVAMLGWLAAAASGAAGWSDVYVRLGHSNTVLVVAFSPDGRTLASGAGDNISQDDLKRLIASIPATKKVLLLDTCQAGALGDALALTTRGDSDQRAINILSGAVGSTVLSAATSQEQALEGMDGHGVFTWVVLQGLDGKADVQKNGYVSTLDLASYVGDQVPKVAGERFKREQFPNLHNAGQSFPIVSSH